MSDSGNALSRRNRCGMGGLTPPLASNLLFRRPVFLIAMFNKTSLRFLALNLSALTLGAAALIGRADNPKSLPTTVPPPAQTAFFENKIRPLLADKCLSCHSGDHALGGLRLDTNEGWKRGGASGTPLFVGGMPEKSLLLTVVHYDSKVKMPPSGKLSDKDIALLTAWVKMGSPLPDYAKKPVSGSSKSASAYPAAPADFWSFRPVKKPVLPKVKATAWVKNPIDAFVLSQLESKGLTPAPPADKRTLLRRVSFDLIGLPPTPKEMADFLNDKSPDAYAKVVDRLLASPHYGERWGRHWLDVARYADSNGADENLAFSNAFRYRDYVIAAYNKDLPYNEFIRQQLAGDLLPASDEVLRNEHITATGFLSLGAKVLAEQDKPKLVMDIVDEQIEVTSKAFLGLTVACARCHNHKFDPIPTADYYALAGIFKSTKTMANLGFVSNWNERSLPTKALEAERERHQKKLDAAQAILNAAKAKANLELARKIGEKADAYLLAGWEAARQPGGFSRAELRPAPGETRILIEAESFVRGNALRDTENYGKGIGVIHTGTPPTFAEWEIEAPAAGNYALELRYAAEESRPLQVLINGQRVKDDAAKGVTGSWNPAGQKWEVEGLFALKQGKNVLRIERSGAIPHLDKLLLIADNRKPTPGSKAETAEEIAKRHALLPAFVKQAGIALSQAQNSPVFLAVALSAEERETAGRAAPKALQFAPGLKINRYLRANLEGKTFTGPEGVLKKIAELLLTDTGNASPERKEFEGFFFSEKGVFHAPEKLESLYIPASAQAVKAAEAEVSRLKEMMPSTPVVMAVDEGRVENCKIHLRGNHLTLGEEVPRHFLTVVSGPKQPPIPETASGRLQLAEWIASPTHPLTGRVIVNRIWQDHFGAGIVRTSDNFGLMGERPSHPELLDWLAANFTDPKGMNWSQKKLHRLILLSSTYRQSAANHPKAVTLDPDNTLLWRMNRLRLQAEPFRDSLMATAGTLNPTMGGTLLVTKNNDYVTNDQSGDAGKYNALRRSVYLPIIRNSLFDMFQAFDFGDPSMVNARRATTTVAPQALYVMNSPFVMEQAKAFANSLLAQKEGPGGEGERVQKAYGRAYSRPASEAEVKRSLSFLKRIETALVQGEPNAAKRREQAWSLYCQTIFAANEFLYVD